MNDTTFNTDPGVREGIKLAKGFQLTPEYIEELGAKLDDQLQYWCAYPDMFLDEIKPAGSGFKFFFYQRIMLRAMMRFKGVYFTAARSTSKSFIAMIALFLQCVFMPGRHVIMTANTKQQAATIAKSKFKELFNIWPLLRKEIVGWQLCDDETPPGNYGRDYVTLKFNNGSQFDVVLASDSARGIRANGAFIDESRDADGDMINNVILPTLTVARRLPDGFPLEKEPNHQKIVATSAGSKATFAYDMLLDMYQSSIIYPNDYFVSGLDYRIPVVHGLISKEYINSLKMAKSYNPQTFATEFMSIWQGGNDDSWFNFDKINQHRRLKNPHWKAHKLQSNQYYYLSYDVARYGTDQSVVCVFLVTIDTTGIHHTSLVNVIMLGKTKERRHFTAQVIDLKRLIRDFKPREVLIDINGIGAGVGDLMIQQQIDEFGEIYPAYGFINDENYREIQPRDCIPLLWGMKASAQIKSKVHSTMYTRIQQGQVNFLIKEQDARTMLMATEKGQRMEVEDRIARLMPHEMTSRLVDEALNFRIKVGSVAGDVQLEPINSSMHDDRYMACAYGIWRIQEIEQNELSRYAHRGHKNRKLVFYTE